MHGIVVLFDFEDGPGFGPGVGFVLEGAREVFPGARGFVELFAGAFGFGGYASFECEFFPFGELFLWWRRLDVVIVVDDDEEIW